MDRNGSVPAGDRLAFHSMPGTSHSQTNTWVRGLHHNSGKFESIQRVDESNGRGHGNSQITDSLLSRISQMQERMASRVSLPDQSGFVHVSKKSSLGGIHVESVSSARERSAPQFRNQISSVKETHALTSQTLYDDSSLSSTTGVGAAPENARAALNTAKPFPMPNSHGRNPAGSRSDAWENSSLEISNASEQQVLQENRRLEACVNDSNRKIQELQSSMQQMEHDFKNELRAVEDEVVRWKQRSRVQSETLAKLEKSKALHESPSVNESSNGKAFAEEQVLNDARQQEFVAMQTELLVLKSRAEASDKRIEQLQSELAKSVSNGTTATVGPFAAPESGLQHVASQFKSTEDLGRNGHTGMPFGTVCEMLESSISEVPESAVTYDTLIDGGSFADVLKGTLSLDVAIKKFRAVSSQEQINAIRHELQLLCCIDHPSIPKVLAVVSSLPEIAICLTLIPGPSLHSHLHAQPGTDVALDVPRVVSIARCLCDALAAVHAKGIVHRDVKPANVILCPDGSVGLVDFGLATTIGSDESQVMAGTPVYLAPEVLSGMAAEPGSDMYSVGVLLWECMTGLLPWEGVEVNEISNRVINGERLGIPEGCPKELTAVLERLWSPSPQDRLTAQAAVTVFSHMGAEAPPSTCKGLAAVQAM